MIVDSTNLRQAEYDRATRTLVIVFQNQRKYEYYDVPPSVWRELQALNRPGRMFYHEVRLNYVYNELL